MLPFSTVAKILEYYGIGRLSTSATGEEEEEDGEIGERWEPERRGRGSMIDDDHLHGSGSSCCGASGGDLAQG